MAEQRNRVRSADDYPQTPKAPEPVQDVYEQLEIAEVLRRSEAQLANAQALAHIGSWELDLLNDSWWCSDEFYQVLGVERRSGKRPAGTSHRTRLSTEALRARVPNLDTLLSLDDATHGATTLRSTTVTLPSGETRFIEARTTITLDEASGQLRRMEGTVQDVTERELARQALEERNAELESARLHARAILDTASEAMLLVDRDSRIAAVNARFDEFFGIPGHAVVGRSLADVVRELPRTIENPDTLIDALADATQDRLNTLTVEVQVLSPVPRQLSLHSTPVNASGSAHLARLYAFRDVTREREADRLKSEFVSMVSHELLTPLTSVKGYLGLYLDVTEDDLSTEHRALLDGMNRNVERLLKLIRDLLDAARIEAGQFELRTGVIRVAEVVDHVTAAMEVQLSSKGQTVEVSIPSDLPSVSADRDRTDQVLTNLVSNASKYSGTGSTIHITAEVADNMVAISVRDEGIGISREDAAHIFERFFRAHNPAARAVGGSGLGLSITRSLVELQGGSLAVESEPGIGSIFTFTIPIAAEATLEDEAFSYDP